MADYQQAQFRQYQRLTKGIKPDIEAYKQSVEKWGDDFTANSLAYGEHGAVSREGLDRMVEDLKQQCVVNIWRLCTASVFIVDLLSMPSCLLIL